MLTSSFTGDNPGSSGVLRSRTVRAASMEKRGERGERRDLNWNLN